MGNNIKARTWGVIVYPESAPEDWMELLAETYLQFAVSPLHDKDTNPDGQVKKAHRHVILAWDGPVTQTAASKLANKINAAKPIKLESVRGAYRYFTHKDNPEKFQYDEKDIKVFNGFDISSYISPTREEKYNAVAEIIQLVKENNYTEYFELVSDLLEKDYDLFKVACDNTILINGLVRSRRYMSDR